MQYSNGIAKKKEDAINNALGEHIDTRDDKLLIGSNLFLLMHKNYWKYGENGVLQGFAKVSENQKAYGALLTSVAAPAFLPMNAVGQTNAAFLEQLSKKPEQERMQFIKGNLHVLEEMNENLNNYVRQRAQEEDCPWLESPESLKAALNGGMVRDYKKALTQSLKETGNMPEVGTTMDNLMRTDSIMIKASEGPVVGGN